MGRQSHLEQEFQTMAQRISRFGATPHYLNELGGTLYELGRLPEAEKAFETACKLDEDFEPARRNLKQLRIELANLVPNASILSVIRRLAPVKTANGLIRVGGLNDGGYLLPNDMDGIEFCFSPGVGPSSSFEKALESYGIHSFLADASVDGPATNLTNFTFDKLFIGKDGEEDQISLASWVDRYVPAERSTDMLLQMDIEGAEYPVLNAAPRELLRRFRIIVVEFHSLNLLRNAKRHSELAGALDNILQDFHVVHLHPNNCCGSLIMAGVEIPRVMEITFLRKDRDPGSTFVSETPHPLDRDCVLNTPSLPLDPGFLRAL